jgi:hypothetical protein
MKQAETQNNLRLSLKTKWFEMTKAGIKTEDYREITPYWCAMFLGDVYGSYTRGFWAKVGIDYVVNSVSNGDFSTRHYLTNTMTLGYPKTGDSERILKLEHKGIEIRTGNPEWGAEPNKLYFVIKHGKIIL